MIRFGAMSIVLLCGALYGVLCAAMLCALPARRAANRLLAALILVLALYTAPYIIGYAGYYDAYPWLSFAPYNLTLAAAPLLFLYVRCISGGGRLPPRWALHLLPGLLQLIYYCIIFAQPLAFKNSWDAGVQQPLVDRIETLALMLSLSGYWALACRDARALGDAHAQATWLRNLLAAFGVTVALWWLLAGCELATGGLTYFQRFPFYMWLGVLVAYLGTAGQRHGAQPFVVSTSTPKPLPKPAPTPPSAIDIAALGAQWRATIIERQWWRDPELSLASLARLLGTNTTTLSRALNEGLGSNFNEVINRMRVDAVIAALKADDPATPQPVLDIALAEGFNSKASFNRAFKLYAGQTPSQYRRQLGASSAVSVSG